MHVMVSVGQAAVAKLFMDLIHKIGKRMLLVQEYMIDKKTQVLDLNSK